MYEKNCLLKFFWCVCQAPDVRCSTCRIHNKNLLWWKMKVLWQHNTLNMLFVNSKGTITENTVPSCPLPINIYFHMKLYSFHTLFLLCSFLLVVSKKIVHPKKKQTKKTIVIYTCVSKPVWLLLNTKEKYWVTFLNIPQYNII